MKNHMKIFDDTPYKNAIGPKFLRIRLDKKMDLLEFMMELDI